MICSSPTPQTLVHVCSFQGTTTRKGSHQGLHGAGEYAGPRQKMPGRGSPAPLSSHVWGAPASRQWLGWPKINKTRSGPKRPAAEIGGDFFGIHGFIVPILVHCQKIKIIQIFQAKLDPFWFVVRRLRTSGFFSGKIFEAVLASKQPQRPNLTSPMALSWPITPSYQFSGVFSGCFCLLLNFQRRRREPTVPRPAS